MTPAGAVTTVPEDACLQFAGTHHHIRLRDAAAVADVLQRIAPTWPLVPPTGDPLITVTAVADRYTVEAPWLDGPVAELGVASAACSVFVDVSRLVLDADPNLLCLHAAALETAGGLVVLCGERRAGKSTLATRLSAGPARLFCDDILPLDLQGNGIALGVAPRLRLPLPVTASDAFADYCATHLAAFDERYGYVMPPALAPHGTRAPLRAVVVLDRRQDGPAGLVAASTADAVHHLVRRNLARQDGATAILDRLEQLGRSVAAVRLYYSNIDEAAELLLAAFSTQGPLPLLADDGAAGRPLEPVGPSDEQPAAADLDPARSWRRRAGVGVRSIDGLAFLTTPGDEAILELNATGLAVWRLIEQRAASAGDLAQLLQLLFPEVAERQLLADVARLLGDLRHHGLIEPAS